uniref:Natural killer cell granule protein 7 n=1 Tax=Salvator merianae TaxID=96440 RepID=A0A8D0BDM4_SALMN
MLACRISSILMVFTSIIVLFIALTTDYWLIAFGPKSFAHSGLWTECRDGHSTRVFLILASLVALASVLFLASSFMPCPCSLGNNHFIPSFIAFAAGLLTLIAVAVYTSESWDNNQDPQIQLTFGWSFYLGWAAFPMLLLAGLPNGWETYEVVCLKEVRQYNKTFFY